ncbi:hypothetical protein FQZ97_536800 [compost metagenome]
MTPEHVYYLVVERSTGYVLRAIISPVGQLNTQSAIFVEADSVLLHRFCKYEEQGIPCHINAIRPGTI